MITSPLQTSESNALMSLQQQQHNFNHVLFYKYVSFMDCKETTLKGYTTAVKQFAQWLTIEDIQNPIRGDIQAYKQYLNDSELSNGTQHQYLRAVKNFFEWTDSENLYPNVAKGIKLPKVRHDTHKKDALTVEDVRIIDKSINRDTEDGKRLYAMFLLCVCCGLRTIELQRANVEDIKTLNGHSFLYIQGKGRDEKDQRKALNEKVVEALDQYLNCRSVAPTAKSPLFVSTSNRSKGKRIASTTISTMLKTMLVQSGYDSDRLTAHSLRHTAGTTAYNVSSNIYQTQRFMRHEDTKTTEIYVHDTNETKNEIEMSEKIMNAYYNDNDSTNDREKAHELVDRLTENDLKALLEEMERRVRKHEH